MVSVIYHGVSLWKSQSSSTQLVEYSPGPQGGNNGLRPQAAKNNPGLIRFTYKIVINVNLPLRNYSFSPIKLEKTKV